MRLQEYRWVLRISRKNAEFLEIASGILESAVGVLLRNAETLDSRKLAFPLLQQSVDDSPQGPMDDEEENYYGSGADDAYMEDMVIEHWRCWLLQGNNSIYAEIDMRWYDWYELCI